jgi:dephospho-CoA kinase
MLKIGLTGNIAAGKSIVQSYLEKKGIPIIDADWICHRLMDNNEEVIEKITKLFEGKDIFLEDGRLGRHKIGLIVFSNPEKMEALEAILHPLVEKKILEFFEENENEEIVVASVPLLFEENMQNLFDKTILVCADKKLRLQRLMNRNGYSLEHALERINSQVSQEEKRYMADFIIENNNDLIELETQINKTIERLWT